MDTDAMKMIWDEDNFILQLITLVPLKISENIVFSITKVSMP